MENKVFLKEKHITHQHHFCLLYLPMILQQLQMRLPLLLNFFLTRLFVLNMLQLFGNMTRPTKIWLNQKCRDKDLLIKRKSKESTFADTSCRSLISFFSCIGGHFCTYSFKIANNRN